MDCISGFDIRLEKDVFYPGEALSGVVLLDTNAPLRLRGIRVFLRGRARVQWKMLKSGESRTLKDDQYLLDEKLVLWGRDRNEEGGGEAGEQQGGREQSQILARGTHEMAFQFQLPATQMPCSLETKAGTVRYYIKVIVDVPYASSPQGLKYFTLIAPHIDCMEEKYLAQLSAQDHQVRWAGCCKRGVVALRVVLERSAYCSGEMLLLRVQLENRQYLPALICVRLVQHLEYRIDRGAGPVIETKSVQSTVMEWRSPLIPEHSQYRLEPGKEPALRVPVVPPTMVGFCRLLQLYYKLRVCASDAPRAPRKPSAAPASGPAPSSAMPASGAECLDMDFPLTVATVPFRPGHSQLYSVGYDFCVDHVETGKYISPEFRLGQVWDGRGVAERAEEGDNGAGGGGGGGGPEDDVILYRPVYVKLAHSQQQQGADPGHKAKQTPQPSPQKQQLTAQNGSRNGHQINNATK